MKLLIPLLAAQLFAVMLAEHHQNGWDAHSTTSLVGLVSTAGYLICKMLTYKS
ncbi:MULTISPECIES: hypothetical protein [unclassified Chryseobacterium]|uniref:hypothetical protein n=1 Tax=unclassified Chryseobacterium TaxID=2593645 RepID=UPI000A9846C2|nr:MULTISPECIES: hypothetical protein [unclassified Chryseobacterium]